MYHIHSCSPSLVAHHDQLCRVGKVDLLSLKKNYTSPKSISSVVILLSHRSFEKDSLALFRVHIVNHGLQPRSQLCNTNLFQAKKIKITLYSSLLSLSLSLSLSHLVVSTSHVLVVVVDLRLGTTPGGRGANVVYHL